MPDEIHAPAEARNSAQEREAARHELTIKAASALFAQFGVPRSPRSVQGFCKDGHIDSVRVKGPNGDRYFINEQSVEQYAIELKQIEEVGKISSDEPSAQQREPARESAQQRAVVVPEPYEEPELEDWLDDWNQQYQEYRSLDQDKQTKNNHSWFVDMEQRFLHLKNLLQQKGS